MWSGFRCQSFHPSRDMTLAVVLAVGVVALAGCSRAGDQGAKAPPLAPPPIDRHSYEKGYVRFVNRLDLPNTGYNLRGKMEVTVWESYVKVDEGGDKVWYVPRERLIYAGEDLE